jgi:hypothetical protein
VKLSKRIVKQAERLDEKQTKGLPLNRKERRILGAVTRKVVDE